MSGRQSGIVVWSLTLAVLGCGGGPEPPQPLAAVPTTARLYYDNLGGIRDSLTLVIRTEAEWRDLWTRATSVQPSPPPIPTVDFENEMVLVVAAGPMTPEDQIRVDSVGVREVVNMEGERERVLTATVRIIVGCGGFGGEAFPLEIVRVRDYRGEVDFRVSRSPAPGCPQDETRARGPAVPRKRGTREAEGPRSRAAPESDRS